MSVPALITEGIGPGGSVKYVLTGGLDLTTTPPPSSGGVVSLVTLVSNGIGAIVRLGP